MTPDYSVIVPVYDVEKYLSLCVDSILAQTFRNYELILVDDGSHDGCGAICDGYARQDGRIRVIHQENRGLNGARRSGFALARAEYICFVDSDDTVSPDWLETVDRCVRQGGQPDMLYYGYVRVSGQEQEVRPPRPEAGLYDKARMEKEIYPYLLYDRRKPFLARMMTAFAWSKVYRRRLLEEHFLTDARIRLFEDVAMTYECVCAADTLYVIPFTPYFYRYNDQSLLNNPRSDYLPNIRWCIDYMRGHLGAMDPEMFYPQINANMVMRIIDSLSRDIRAGRSFREVLARFRSGMERSRLDQVLTTGGLPLPVGVFVFLLRRRLYRPAVMMAWAIYGRGSAG